MLSSRPESPLAETPVKGHDDAVAILLASQLENTMLLGISTVHGNTTAEWTLKNATRLVLAFAPHRPDIIVHPGATTPLLRAPRADPEIHGPGGLGGVVGLLDVDDEIVQTALARSQGLKAIGGLADQVRMALNAGEKITIVATGPLTNIALFVSVYPELLPGVEQICFMGGGVGVGNRSAVSGMHELYSSLEGSALRRSRVQYPLRPRGCTDCYRHKSSEGSSPLNSPSRISALIILCKGHDTLERNPSCHIDR